MDKKEEVFKTTMKDLGFYGAYKLLGYYSEEALDSLSMRDWYGFYRVARERKDQFEEILVDSIKKRTLALLEDCVELFNLSEYESLIESIAVEKVRTAVTSYRNPNELNPYPVDACCLAIALDLVISPHNWRRSKNLMPIQHKERNRKFAAELIKRLLQLPVVEARALVNLCSFVCREETQGQGFEEFLLKSLSAASLNRQQWLAVLQNLQGKSEKICSFAQGRLKDLYEKE